MVGYSMRNNHNKLIEAKAKYYSLAKKSRYKGAASKGGIRAFISLLTWQAERELISSGEDKFSAHITAFIEAIEKSQTLLRGRAFEDDFSIVLKRWTVEKNHEIPREPGGSPLVVSPSRDNVEYNNIDLKVISLFSGGFGLDIGFKLAGFQHALALDIDRESHKTIACNLPDLPIIKDDIKKISTKEILNVSGIRPGELDVLVGGPPCQPFSPAGKRASLMDPRASPLLEFVRVIKEAKPRCFVMEEVEGLMSARLKHITIEERGKRKLEPGELQGSAFREVLEMLKGTGYKFEYDLLNAADFGAPQSRKRLIFIGLRDGYPSMPIKTHSDMVHVDLTGAVLKPWNTFWEATVDLQGSEQETSKLSSISDKFLRMVPPGGNWRNLPSDIIKKAMGGAYNSGGGKMGYFRRIAWCEPSPTVVTSPTQKGTMFCHPEANRPLSVNEYKRVQGFPDDWEFPVSTASKYKLIGNAVPVFLSYAIAKKVRDFLVQP